MTTRIASISEVAQFLRSMGIPGDAVKLGDESYALPTREWVQRFASAYTALVREQGLSQWTEQVFDCENHAMRCTLEADKIHAETFFAQHQTPNCGLAFGELWVGSRGHAIVFCLHLGDSNELAFQAYEPQLTGPQQISLNPFVLFNADFPTVQLAKLQ